MKTLFLNLSVCMLLVGFISCNKNCEVCKKESSPEIKVCEDDYNSKTEYGFTIDYLESTGYTCR